MKTYRLNNLFQLAESKPIKRAAQLAVYSAFKAQETGQCEFYSFLKL